MENLKEKYKKARKALNKLHYFHEITYRFENYTTPLQSNFQLLERFDIPFY